MKTETATLYFAYGSNLNESRMNYRCPSSMPLFKATLPGYRLTFQANVRGVGVANIVPDKAHSVPGYVFLLTRRCQRTLDACEGVPVVYDRLMVEVESQQRGRRGKVECMTYAMVGEPAIALPEEGYFSLIYSGYKSRGLDRLALTDAVVETAQWVEEHPAAPPAPKKQRKPRGKKSEAAATYTGA